MRRFSLMSLRHPHYNVTVNYHRSGAVRRWNNWGWSSHGRSTWKWRPNWPSTWATSTPCEFPRSPARSGRRRSADGCNSRVAPIPGTNLENEKNTCIIYDVFVARFGDVRRIIRFGRWSLQREVLLFLCVIHDFKRWSFRWEFGDWTVVTLLKIC